MEKNENINDIWYIDFFARYYLHFLGREIKKLKTKDEVNFIMRTLHFSKSDKKQVLDLACGHGRHAIELAKKNLDVTCLDSNRNFLLMIGKQMKKNKISMRLIHSDMRFINSLGEFDAIINMFSSFGYFRKENENSKVLKSVFKALKPGGLFLLDLPNKRWFLSNIGEEIKQKIKGVDVLEKRHFDKKKNIFFNKITFIFPNKKTENITTIMHLYSAAEIRKKLENAGFRVVKWYGDYKSNKFQASLSPRMIILVKK